MNEEQEQSKVGTGSLIAIATPEICGCLAVFLVSLGFTLLLSLAYPDGMFSLETLSYLGIERAHYKFFDKNTLDWWRTFAYPMVIHLAKVFPQPSCFIYWLNASLFCLNITLTYLLARALSLSRTVSLMFALTALLFEVAVMHTFFENLQLSTDPLVAELVQLTCLLVLIAFLKAQPKVLIAGYATLGIASFVKQSSLGMVIVFAILLFFFVRPWKVDIKLKRATIATSFLVMVLPMSLWTARNYVIFGFGRSSGMFGYQLMQDVLPFVQAGDAVLDDRAANDRFIVTIQDIARRSGYRSEIEADPWKRVYLFEAFSLPWEHQPYGAFDLVSAQICPDCPDEKLRSVFLYDASSMFELDPLCRKIALRIILKHPALYAKKVVVEYIDFFTPACWPAFRSEKFQADGSSMYGFTDQFQKVKLEQNYDLYPLHGRPRSHLCNGLVGHILAFIQASMPLGLIAQHYCRLEFFLTHTIFFIAALVFGMSFKRQGAEAELLIERRRCAVLLVFYLTAASNYLVYAAAQVVRWRYAMAGDMALHLMFLLTLFLLVLEALKSMAGARLLLGRAD